MGQHFQLENNELGICLECGLFMPGAELGCVENCELSLKGIKTAIPKKLFQTIEIAYKLQHYQYYSLNELESIMYLLTLMNYEQTHKFASYKTKEQDINNYLHNHFFYCKQALASIFIFNIAECETKQQKIDMAEQYILEIMQAYREDMESLQDLV